jgi:hypothetical protein
MGIYSKWHHVISYLNALIAPSVKGIFFTQNFIQEQVNGFMSIHAVALDEKSNSAVPFLTRFQHLHKEDPEKVRRQDIIEECAANILKHPGIFAKLRAELDARHERGEFQ